MKIEACWVFTWEGKYDVK